MPKSTQGAELSGLSNKDVLLVKRYRPRTSHESVNLLHVWVLVSHVRKLDYLDALGFVDIIRLAPRFLTLALRTNSHIIWDGGPPIGRRSSALRMTLEAVNTGVD